MSLDQSVPIDRDDIKMFVLAGQLHVARQTAEELNALGLPVVGYCDGVWHWWVSADERVTEDPLRSKVRPDIRAELDKAREAGDLRAYRAVVRRLAAERCRTRGDANTRSTCQMSG